VNLHDTMERVVQGFEVAGVAILIVGSLLAFVSAALRLGRGDGRAAYQRARQGVCRAILLGLEVLIIADIVLTITVDAPLTAPSPSGSSSWSERSSASPWRSNWKGPGRGVAARPRSRRTQPSASATDQD